MGQQVTTEPGATPTCHALMHDIGCPSSLASSWWRRRAAATYHWTWTLVGRVSDVRRPWRATVCLVYHSGSWPQRHVGCAASHHRPWPTNTRTKLNSALPQERNNKIIHHRGSRAERTIHLSSPIEIVSQAIVTRQRNSTREYVSNKRSRTRYRCRDNAIYTALFSLFTCAFWVQFLW